MTGFRCFRFRLLALLLFTGIATACPAAFRTVAVSFPKDVLSGDNRVHPVNLIGNEAKELVVSTADSFRIYNLSENGYQLRQTVPLPQLDVGPAGKIYYGFARMEDAVRYNIVLLTARGVVCYPSTPQEILVEPKLIIKRTLIHGQVGGRPLQYFDFALDLDNDGLDDLLLPEEDGFSIFRQTKAMQFEPVKLPRNPYKRQQQFQLRRDLSHHPHRAPSFSGYIRRQGGVSDLLIFDANSDGLPDLVYTDFGPGPNSTEVERYDIFLQRRGMTFSEKPSQSLVVPYDPRTDITFRDLNRDSRLDVITVRSNIDIANPRTITRIFLSDQRPEQYLSRETARFVTKDPIGLVSIGDYNSDGFPDFATTYFSYQFSSVDDIVDLALANKVQFKLQFFAGAKGNDFNRPPDTEKELLLQIKAESLHGGPPFMLVDDLNGDKFSDLIVRTREEELSVYTSEGPMAFSRNPSETLPFPDPGSVDIVDLNADGLQDILISSPTRPALSIHLSNVR